MWIMKFSFQKSVLVEYWLKFEQYRKYYDKILTINEENGNVD